MDDPSAIRAPDWNRTSDLRYRKPVLYPLSYGGVPIDNITALERSELVIPVNMDA